MKGRPDREQEAKALLLSSAPNATTTERRDEQRRHYQGCLRVLLTYTLAFALAFVVSKYLPTEVTICVNESEVGTAEYCDDVYEGYTCRPEISRLWGQYSPYWSVPSEIDDTVPRQCNITFAQILSRHGARDPTLKRTLKYSSTVTKIKATVSDLTGKYEFLRNYHYELGADQLNAFGEQQLINSGIKFYNRYKHLARHDTPFIRSAGQRRVVESADAWMEGYHRAKQADDDSSNDDYPYAKVLIHEGPTQNNTLAHSRCNNIETGPLSNVRKDAKDAWINVYGPPILKRLRDDLPEADLEMEDLHSLMSLCPFDTVRTFKGEISPFCDLFTGDEWHQYNQLESIEKFYGWGKGNPLGPTQGVGFTNELIARMTHQRPHDWTSTNHTLNDDPETFPVGDKYKMFADFSHDNDLTSAFHAMGLYNSTPMLSITQVDSIDYTKGWSSAWTVPFAARAYFEKMECTGEAEELVRVIVNDRVLPLEMCGGDKLGRCKLSEFVDSLAFARHGGHWDECFLDIPSMTLDLDPLRAI